MTVQEEADRSLRAAALRRFADDSNERLAQRYAETADRLSRLHAAPVPDGPAIDAAIREMDDLHAAFKARHARLDDAAQF